MQVYFQCSALLTGLPAPGVLKDLLISRVGLEPSPDLRFRASRPIITSFAGPDPVNCDVKLTLEDPKVNPQISWIGGRNRPNQDL